MKHLLFGIWLFAFFLPQVDAQPVEEEDIPQALFGCVKTESGKLRIVESIDHCLPSESAVSFAVGQLGRRCPIGQSTTGFSSEGKLICTDGSLASIRIGDDCPHNLVAGADLRNCDLSNRDLRNFDLSNINASGAIFTDSYLIQTNFTNANLEGAQFYGARMGGTTFDGAVLNNTNIGSGASYAYANTFVSATLRDSNINILGDDNNFTDADLTNSKLVLSGATNSFTQADLTNTTINIQGNGHAFEYANLTDAKILMDSPSPEQYSFKGATIDRLNFLGKNCSYCDFSDTTGDSAQIRATLGGMQYSKFDGANLPNLRLYADTRNNSYNFYRSSFVDAIIPNLYIYGRCEYCDFRGADLSDATMYRAIVTGSKFDNTSLVRAYVQYESWLRNTSFVGADLSSLKFYPYTYSGITQLSGANFTDATLLGADFYQKYFRAGYQPTWSNTTCPNGTNSDDNGGNCDLTQ